MGLPRPASLTDALLAPPCEERPADMGALRDRVVRALGGLADTVPRGEHVRIDVARTMFGLTRPEQGVAHEARPFSATARACRRAIGLAAVNRCVRGLSRAPAAAVSEVLEAGVEDVARGNTAAATRSPWWAGWYAGLPLGGRAAVEAEAVTWATHLVTALEWWRFERPPVIGGRDDWWQAPNGRLAVPGRAEVRAQLDTRASFLVVAGRWCSGDWRIRLGFPALVSLLARGERALPCRVIGMWPSSGQTRVLHIDATLIDEVAQTVVSTAATWIGASAPAEARPVARAG
jgi:hypothetical protein